MTILRPRGRLASALLASVPVAVAIATFALMCGAIEGSPKCGPPTILAVLVVVAALVLEGWLFHTSQSMLVDSVLIAAVAWVVAVLLCLLLAWLADKLRRTSPRYRGRR